MEYATLSATVSAVAEELRQKCPEFAEVREVCLTGFENLFELLNDLAHFPAAVVTAGNLRYTDAGASREVEIAVIAVDEFRISPEEATAGFELADAVSRVLTGTVPGVPPRIGGLPLMLESVEPIELDAGHMGWQFSFNAVASCVIA